MLRNFIQSADLKLIFDALETFELPFDRNTTPVVLYYFEALTPDSFLWELSIAGETYYLYAEDYIPSLVYVKKEMTHYTGTEGWEFIRPRVVRNFEGSSPVKSSIVYEAKSNTKEFMQYASQSGYDFVFLVKLRKGK